MQDQNNKNPEPEEGQDQQPSATSQSIDEIESQSPSLEELRMQQSRFYGQDAEPPKVTVYEGEAGGYVRKLKEQKPRTYDDVERDFFNNLYRCQRVIAPAAIDFDSARRLVWDGIQQVLQQHGKEWIKDDFNTKVLPNLIRYFIGQKGEYRLYKGIFLMGEVETGKTFLMKIMRTLVDSIPYEHRKFKIVSTTRLQFDVMRAKSVQPLEVYIRGVYCFDDLGTEADTLIYGNEVRIFDTLMQIRYDAFQNYGMLTHATSNVSPSKLPDTYDERTVSRMREMFNFVYLGGEKKRN